MATKPVTPNQSLDGPFGLYEAAPSTFPVTPNQSLDGPYGSYVSDADRLPVTPNQSLDGPYGLFGPPVAIINPAPTGLVCVTAATPITFDVTATLPATVDLTTAVAVINGETAYSLGAFNAPWSGTVTDNSTAFLNVQSFSLVRTPALAGGTIVTVDVAASDSNAVAALPLSWWFVLCVAPPPVVVYSPIASPAYDTFRGGKRISTFVEPYVSLFDATKDDAFTARTLGALWTPTLGAPSEYEPTDTGLAVHSKQSGSFLLTSVWSAAHGRVEVECRLSSAVTVTLRWNVAAALAELMVTPTTAALSVGGQTFSVDLPPSATRTRTLTLALIRNADRIWAFVDDLLVGPDEAQPNAAYATAVGAVELYVVGRGTAKLTNLTVRSHATAGRRAMRDVVAAGGNRLLATVPAARLTQVGATELRVFGLFGQAVGGDFQYVLPDGKSPSSRPATTGALVNYSDPVLRGRRR